MLFVGDDWAEAHHDGELHVLVWDGQALASRLEVVATTVHRLAWPTPMSTAPPALELPPPRTRVPQLRLTTGFAPENWPPGRLVR